MRLLGKRIQLRDIQSQDRDSLIHWLHPRHEWHQFNGPYYPPTPVDEIPTMVEKWISADLPDLRRRLIIADINTNRLMGTVSRYWISEETNWTAIGIGIYDPQNWGKGIGYEALGLWCDSLFRTNSDFVRLDLRTWSGNIGMMKLAEKLGFQLEARFRKARIVDGKYYDGLGYGILREEWDQRYPNGFANRLI